MSQLIQLRQRIKAIKTIQKITHAMRLISMSSHSRLRRQQEPLQLYQEEVGFLLNHAIAQNTQWKHPFIQQPSDDQPRTLLICIGGQKGLCGNFNSALFAFINSYITKNINNGSYDIIGVGKKLADFVEQEHTDNTRKLFDYFTSHNYLQLAQEIITFIEQNAHVYSHIVILSNKSESFFVRHPRKTILTPLSLYTHTTHKEEYIWEQPSTDVLDYLVEEYVYATIQYTLFESLLSEHAARFISMDNSTRNADEILEQAQLTYNKLRQTKITRELTELVGSYL